MRIHSYFFNVLKAVDGKVELMIELKNTNHKFNKILVKEVYELLKDYKGKYVIVSFNPFMLLSYKRLDKNAFIGRVGTTKTKGIIEKIKGFFTSEPPFRPPNIPR